MANVRLLNENYADADLIVSQTYSSQASATPATNVLAKTRRTKTWRSAGYWNITSSNNVIKFKDSGGGSTLTATIAVAEYLTDATFLAAVKAAFQAAGANTYTLSRDATSNKIKIASNGAAFQLLCTNVGFTAATILGFSTASDRTGALTYTADVLKIHTSEWLRWDLGTASNVQAFVLIGLQNEGIQLSSSAVITLKGNATDTWAAPSYSQVLTWNEDAIGVFNTTGLYTGGLRYWRLEIVDASNADGYVEISNIYLGEIYEPTQGMVNFPLAVEFIDLTKADASETGVMFANVIQQTAIYNLNWFGLTKTEFEVLTQFIKDHGVGYPFFISLDPNSVYSSSAGKWIKYCRFNVAPKARLESPNVFSMDWQLREEL
jgi:hypothetical protein